MRHNNLSVSENKLADDPESFKATVPVPSNVPTIGQSPGENPTFITLKSYTPIVVGRRWGTNKSKKKRNYSKPHQAYADQFKLDAVFSQDNKFNKLKTVTDINLWKEANIIAANKELELYFESQQENYWIKEWSNTNRG